MSMIENLQLWNDAVTEYGKENYTDALNKFRSMTDKSAKIHFNIGCVYLALGQKELAVKAFLEAIQRDEHFSVGHFLLGQIHFQLTNYKQALRGFEEALSSMRGKVLIDYKQLGLNFKLEAHEILINQAVCLVNLGHIEHAGAGDKLFKALQLNTTQENVLHSLQQLQSGKKLKPIVFPNNLLFKPSKAKIANLPKRDYLGKAKVVVSTDNDFGTGFSAAAKVQQSTEGERYQVLYDFTGSTPQELSVSAGDIALVTEKGSDGWFTVMLLKNNKTGLVPESYLEKKNEEKKVEISSEPSERDALLKDLRKQESRASLKRTAKPPNRKPPQLPKGMVFGGKKAPVGSLPPEQSPSGRGTSESSRSPAPTSAPPRRQSKSAKPAVPPPINWSTFPPHAKKPTGAAPELPDRPAMLKKTASHENTNFDVSVNVVSKVSVKVTKEDSFQQLLSLVARSSGISSSKASLWYESNKRQMRVDNTNIQAVLEGLRRGECTLWCYDS